MSQNRSGTAVGFTMFAAFMMILIGSFHIITGIAGILEDEFSVAIPNWVLQFDATTWGWIHVLAGTVVLLAGFGLFSGAAWARTVGVIMATVSAVANFAFIPYYPFWSTVATTARTATTRSTASVGRRARGASEADEKTLMSTTRRLRPAGAIPAASWVTDAPAARSGSRESARRCSVVQTSARGRHPAGMMFGLANGI